MSAENFEDISEEEVRHHEELQRAAEEQARQEWEADNPADRADWNIYKSVDELRRGDFLKWRAFFNDDANLPE